MENESFKDALEELKMGNAIIYPTESFYALGCDAENEDAVALIYKLKNRPYSKPMPLICGSSKMARKYGVFNRTAKILSEIFWPGPLTLVMDKTERVPDILNKKEIAIRVSSEKIAKELSERFKKALVSTSANLSGMSPSYEGDEVRRIFPKIFMIDAGRLFGGAPSTIFDTRDRSMIREGAIPKKEIQNVLERLK